MAKSLFPNAPADRGGPFARVKLTLDQGFRIQEHDYFWFVGCKFCSMGWSVSKPSAKFPNPPDMVRIIDHFCMHQEINWRQSFWR